MEGPSSFRKRCSPMRSGAWCRAPCDAPYKGRSPDIGGRLGRLGSPSHSAKQTTAADPAQDGATEPRPNDPVAVRFGYQIHVLAWERGSWAKPRGQLSRGSVPADDGAPVGVEHLTRSEVSLFVYCRLRIDNRRSSGCVYRHGRPYTRQDATVSGQFDRVGAGQTAGLRSDIRQPWERTTPALIGRPIITPLFWTGQPNDSSRPP